MQDLPAHVGDMADTDGKPQDGSNGGAPTATAAAVRAQQPTRKVDRRIEELAREYGSKHAALKHLTTRLLNLEEENEGLRGKLPKDGEQVVMPKAEADAYRALGKPDAVAALVGKVTDLEKKEADRQRADRHRTLAAQAGVNADALAALAASQGFDVADVKDVDLGNGQTAKAMLVRPAGDEKAEPKPLADYAADRGFAALLPALSVSSAGGGSSASSAAPSIGVPFGAQSGVPAGQSGGGGRAAEYNRIRQEEAARVEQQRKAASAGSGAERLGLVRRSA